ncbi:metalloproteinase inhibitor 3-like [Dreissena polymorpha]|uniref:NTR domain-containing protein n=1 Tax=Dreissena polymorpha TaxID=45954 RepID=A0A9D4N4W8_DREPO|nr:metalloproteinase inhibitor 3-like [Dreissena polymorpha]KAH3889758.1 hypothetical protein DPMN_013821 [Dreissena polymorpha]
MNIAYVLFALSAAVFCYGEACRCGFEKKSDNYCRAEWAAILYVEGVQEVVDRIYDIRILETLKGNIQQADKNHLKTVRNSCGVPLQVNKYYVISGGVSDGHTLTTDLCKFIRKFDSNPAGSVQVPTCPASSRRAKPKLPKLIIST